MSQQPAAWQIPNPLAHADPGPDWKRRWVDATDLTVGDILMLDDTAGFVVTSPPKFVSRHMVELHTDLGGCQQLEADDQILVLRRRRMPIQPPGSGNGSFRG